MDIPQKIAQRLKIEHQSVTATIELIDTGCTIPFIARYRKERTGSLDEDQIRKIGSLLDNLRNLENRRKTILSSIKSQGKLTASLRTKIERAEVRTELEDLYQPFRPKRETRASKARDRGLQPLADLILEQPAESEHSQSLQELSIPFLNEEVLSPEDAWSGARDIAAETISDQAEIRRKTRLKGSQWGTLQSTRVKEDVDTRQVYKNYYDSEFRINHLRPHQILALNRGEKENILRVKINIPERDWRGAIEDVYPVDQQSPFAEQLDLALKDGANRLLLPSIERDIRREMTETAEDHAVKVFSTNLRNLLTQSPLIGYVIMGIDPGYRTGCKVAVVDPTGKPLETTTIYPHPPQKAHHKAKEILSSLISRHAVNLIAIGNGTASRETEMLVAELIQEFRKVDPTGTSVNEREENLHYLIVSEAGASVYSASELARLEMPDLDVSLRGAVSIARRVQDPLAELVKIDPKSLGVGMYQHDIDPRKLTDELDSVVESAVNFTGVDLNSASPALLSHVSGIGPALANRIVEYRDQKGPFRSREALLDVPGLGPKSFEQSAGFLRIRGSCNPLDQTAIHPESYTIAEELLKYTNVSLDSSIIERKTTLEKLHDQDSLQPLAEILGTGIPTLRDIIEQIIRPGRDPREDFPLPILRSDVLTMDDLIPGLSLKGTVRNVVDFGAFIDIGVKQDGLLHRSKIPHGTNLMVGDILQVKVLAVDSERSRISLGWSGTVNIL